MCFLMVLKVMQRFMYFKCTFWRIYHFWNIFGNFGPTILWQGDESFQNQKNKNVAEIF